MCDTLVALPPATATGTTLFAKNSDRPPHEPQDLRWLAPRRDRGPVQATHIGVHPHRQDTHGVLASLPRWGWGAEHGVNDAGLAVGNEAIYTTLDPRPFPDALTGMDLVRLVLERAGDAGEGVEVLVSLLERYGQGGTGQAVGHRPYWSSFLLADPTTACVVETSGRAWAAEPVARTRAISNRTTIAAFEARRHPRQPVAERVDPRLAASAAVLAAEPVTVAALQDHLRSHDQPGGWSVCMHAGGEEQTTASLVAELWLDRPARAWVLLGSPCRSLYVPVEVGEPLGRVPDWERFAALTPEASAALRPMEAGLATAALPARDAWARVAAALDGAGNRAP